MSAPNPFLLATALQWLAEGRGVAIATVLQTWGSAPQPVGSQLLIDADGNFLGSVSGGCVEAEVIAQAAYVIATGASKDLEFGVEDNTAWKVGLACGGAIRASSSRSRRAPNSPDGIGASRPWRLRVDMRLRSTGWRPMGSANRAAVGRHLAVNQREIVLAYRAVLELGGKMFKGSGVLGHHQGAGGVLVEPVDDPRPELGADAAEVRAVIEQAVDERPGVMARGRMHDQPRRLVDHQDVGVFVQDVERNGFGLKPAGLRGRNAIRKRCRPL